MIGRNAHSRRAEEFDAAAFGRATTETQERFAELLDVVGALRAVPAPMARPEYVAALRGQLMRAAADMPKTPHADRATELRLTPNQRRGGRDRRIAAVLGGFAVVAASGSMAVASQGALPGDALYPVKRAIENAHANLQSSQIAKASVLLDNAENRLSEVEELSARGDGADSSEITTTLQDFKEQTSQASAIAISDFSAHGDDTGLSEVRTFADSTMDRLAALDDVLPTEARPALIAAAQTVRSVDSAAYDACPTCTEGQIAQLPDFAAAQPMGAPIALPTTSTPDPVGSSGSTSTAPSSGPTGTPRADHSDAAVLPTLPADGGSSHEPGLTDVPTESPSDHGVVGDAVDKIAKQLLGDTSTKSGGSGSGGDIVGDVTGILGLR